MKVWAVGGSDPSGGAGLQADLRTFAGFDLRAGSVVTSVTAQNDRRWLGQQVASPRMLAAQIEALLEIEMPKAVKIGLLPDAASVKAIAGAIEVPAVLDPVFASSSGGTMAEGTIEAMRKHLFPKTAILTPNIPEAKVLSGVEINDRETAQRAAKRLLAMGPGAVLLKGGHGEGDCADLFVDAKRCLWLSSPRVEGFFRGTGCTLAAAIAAGLAESLPPFEAVLRAKIYLNACLRSSGASLQVSWPESLSPACVPVLGDAPAGLSFPSLGPEPMGLYPIVPRARWLERLVPLGVNIIQLRIKDLAGRALQKEIAAAAAFSKRAGCRLFVNDHWREAIRSDAYGVHLGQENLDSADLAAISSAGLRMGVSTHSFEEALRAWRLAPSYVALGPIFETTCKSMAFGPQGLGRIREWAALSECPVVAIGGLRVEHAREAVRNGAEGVAVVSDILANADPEGRAREWLARLGSGKSELVC